jgi:hypothetical protein
MHVIGPPGRAGVRSVDDQNPLLIHDFSMHDRRKVHAWNAFDCTGILIKPITMRDAQPGRAVFPRISILMKPLGAVRSGGRSLDAGSIWLKTIRQNPCVTPLASPAIRKVG